jgi:hypothetical protein
MIVLDVSGSTENPSGADVDGDGEIGVDPALELLPPGAFPEGMKSTDPDDSILHAEAQAARALVKGLDPRRVRVGLVTFAGEVDPTTSQRRSLNQQDPGSRCRHQRRRPSARCVRRALIRTALRGKATRVRKLSVAGAARPSPAPEGDVFSPTAPSFPISHDDSTDPATSATVSSQPRETAGSVQRADRWRQVLKRRMSRDISLRRAESGRHRAARASASRTSRTYVREPDDQELPTRRLNPTAVQLVQCARAEQGRVKAMASDGSAAACEIFRARG